MRKFFIALLTMMAVSTASWAEDVTNKGFIITLNGEETLVLYTENPVLTHNEDGTKVFITRTTDEGTVTDELNALEIKLAFCTAETEGTGIELNVQDGENSYKAAIYDLNGRRVSKTVKGQIYVVNGKKVMVK